MGRIQQLSPAVVNKIAAGEVIERPASIVKELVENALDAESWRIDVALERGGADLVRVTDNGGGIAPDELPLAVAPHATSKLRTADDLFRVGTLGFRGEALASIAEVSRLTLTSRPPDLTEGHRLAVDAGQRGEVTPCAAPPGTTIEVRDLFCNTPVRRKFLRATSTELGHASEAFTRVALAHPQVHFTLRHHDKLLHDLPPADPWLARIQQLFGQELADALIWVESRDDAVRLWGYVAHPSQHRSHPRMQYLFLNGRHIRDRSLQHALSEAYRGLLLTGRYPIAFLAVEMPPEQVDVNVHPTKLEVRFQDSGRLYSQLLGTLRTKFLTSDLHARLRAEPGRFAAAGFGGTTERAAGEPSRAATVAAAMAPAADLVRWARDQLTERAAAAPPAWERDDTAAPAPRGTAQLELDLPGRARTPLTLEPVPPELAPWTRPRERREAQIGAGPTAAGPVREPTEAPFEFENGAGPPRGPLAEGHPPSSDESTDERQVVPGRPVPAMQVHNRYLIAETEEGMLVIDQHALHERILYEELRERVLAGAFETQRLLVPEPVDLASSERAAVLEQATLLASLGVGVEPFGGDTVLVTSYPAMLRSVAPGQLLREVAEQLVSGTKTPERRDLLDELLHMLSCKAAIKAGDPLSAAEIAALLARRHLVADAHHCPHGRPTALVFTREQLDRQFQRI